MLAAGLVLASCGHTNKLAQYNVRAQPFEMYVGSHSAGNASMAVNSGTNNAVGDIVAGIGANSLSEETADKLRRAADPDSLAWRIARQFDNALATYLAVKPAPAFNPDALYRAETQLQSYSLSSDSTGIAAHISATSRIIQRSSGIVVWEYTSNKDITLSQTSSALVSGRAMLSAINAATLANMSEDDLASIFYGAAQSVGEDIAETLRQDVAALPQK